MEEKSGIGYFEDNIMDLKEIEVLCSKYLKYAKEYQGIKQKDYVEKKIEKLRKELFECLGWANYIGVTWALYMLEPEQYGADPDSIYNFKLAEARLKAQMLVNQFLSLN